MKERLTEIRKQLKIKQKDFADKLLVSQGHLSDIENGRKDLTDRMIYDICREFYVNENWLRTGEGEMFNKPTDLFTLLGYKSGTMDPETEAVIRNFLLLPDDDRKKFMEFFRKIVADLDREP